MNAPQRGDQEYAQGQYRRNRRLSAIALLVSGGVFGVLDSFWNPQLAVLTVSFGVQILISTVLIIIWCYFDSQIRQKRFNGSDATLVALVGIVGLPAYFWRSRSRREFLLSLGGLSLYALPVMGYALVSTGILAVKKQPDQIFVLLSNFGTPNEGIYTIALADNQQVVPMFEHQQDAIAYNEQLIRQNFLGLSVYPFSRQEIEAFCQAQNHKCRLIRKGRSFQPPQSSLPSDQTHRISTGGLKLLSPS